LGTVLLPDIAEKIQHDQMVQTLANRVVQRLFALHDTPPDIWEEAYFHIMAHERRRDLAKYLLHRAFALNPRDAQFLPLPACLTFLYYFIRPLRQAITYLPRAYRRLWRS
jgi:hypothetical protein